MSRFTGTLPVTKETVDALANLHGCQVVAVRSQVRELAETLDLEALRTNFPWLLGQVPITTEHALSFVHSAPAELSQLQQEPVSGSLFGTKPSDARVLLGQIFSAAEAVEVGTHTLEVINTLFQSRKPNKGDQKVYHGLWKLRSAYHHQPSKSLYFAATITEKLRRTGLSTIVHSLELFYAGYDEEFESVIEEGSYPEDVQGEMIRLQESSDYEHVSNTGCEAELDDGKEEDSARAAKLVAYMIQPLLRETNRKFNNKI